MDKTEVACISKFVLKLTYKSALKHKVLLKMDQKKIFNTLTIVIMIYKLNKIK